MTFRRYVPAFGSQSEKAIIMVRVELCGSTLLSLALP